MVLLDEQLEEELGPVYMEVGTPYWWGDSLL